MLILGNVLCTNRLRTDYAQTDETMASFLLNKPDAAIRSAAETAQAALPKTGGTMTGPIAMGGQKITGLPEPAASTDPATKGYVDAGKTAVSAALSTAWPGNTQTVAVSGVKGDSYVLVTPAPESFVAWSEAGVRCTAQSDGQLSFACQEVPSQALTANILIMNVGGQV